LSLASRRKEELDLKGVRKRPIKDPSLVIRYLEEHGVAYLRQVQVGLEDYMDHETCRHLVDDLVKQGIVRVLRRPSEGGVKWLCLARMSNTEAEALLEEKLRLHDLYLRYERAKSPQGTIEVEGLTYKDYSEYLVAKAIQQAGGVIVDRDVNEFNLRRAPIDSDLDFVVHSPSGDYIGVEVKNTLDYPERKDIEDFLVLCKSLNLKPLFYVRMIPWMYAWWIIKEGGYVVVFKRKFLQPPMPREDFNRLVKIYPIGVYRRPPYFLINKTRKAFEYFKTLS